MSLAVRPGIRAGPPTHRRLAQLDALEKGISVVDAQVEPLHVTFFPAHQFSARRALHEKLVSMRQALGDSAYFGGLLAGDSWAAWRVLLIAVVGEELRSLSKTSQTSQTSVSFSRPSQSAREPGRPLEEF